MKDENSPVRRLLHELLAEDSRFKIASVLEAVEADVEEPTGKGLWARIECHRSDEASAKMLELAKGLLEQVPFPQPFKAEELASSLTDHLSGFDPSALSGEISDTLFGRILYTLVARVGDTRWLQEDLQDPGVCLQESFRELSTPPVHSLRCHVPDSIIADVNSIYRDTYGAGGSWGGDYGRSMVSDHLLETWDREDSLEMAESRYWAKPIWETDDGAGIFLTPNVYDGEDHSEFHNRQAFCYLIGEFSQEALSEHTSFLARSLDSIFKVIASFGTAAESRPYAPFMLRESRDSAGRSQSSDAEIDDDSAMEYLNLPSFKLFHSLDARAAVSAGIEVLQKDENDLQDSLEGRIRNAIHLLDLESKVDDDALALALSFAAAESFLTEPDKPVTQQLSEHGATLLQPERTKRKAATQQIKRLYNYRNVVMHGRRVGGDAKLRRMARRFAAGVFRGVIAHRNHQLRLGHTLDDRELVTELIISHRNQQAVIGVSDLSDLLPYGLKSRS
ncbi:MAG: hypothetical protein WD049_05845 [Candidatus Paceibacterota bacterium]